MDKLSVKKIETLLNASPVEVGQAIGMKSRSGIYRLRKNYPEKYKLLLLGMRVHQSSLNLKDILNLLAVSEKIKG